MGKKVFKVIRCKFCKFIVRPDEDQILNPEGLKPGLYHAMCVVKKRRGRTSQRVTLIELARNMEDAKKEMADAKRREKNISEEA